MDLIEKEESSKNSPIKNYFRTCLSIGSFLLFQFSFLFCADVSPKGTKPTEEKKNGRLFSSGDRVKIHHIYEDIYPNSSASGVLITSEKNSAAQIAHHKGTAKTEKIEVTLGSGIVVNQLGYILTNEHVIRSYDQLSIKLKSGKRYEAKIIGLDKKLDLAILKVEADEEIVPIEVLDTDSLQVVERAIQKYKNAKENLKKKSGTRF
ncbi:S1C family serine protease [Leptospira sp. WS92.C1]